MTITGTVILMMTPSNRIFFYVTGPFGREEIHRSLVNSPHKGLWRRALMFPLICVWRNGWVNNCEAADLRCHHSHYDVTAMYCLFNIKSPQLIWRWITQRFLYFLNNSVLNYKVWSDSITVNIYKYPESYHSLWFRKVSLKFKDKYIFDDYLNNILLYIFSVTSGEVFSFILLSSSLDSDFVNKLEAIWQSSGFAFWKLWLWKFP